MSAVVEQRAELRAGRNRPTAEPPKSHHEREPGGWIRQVLEPRFVERGNRKPTLAELDGDWDA